MLQRIKIKRAQTPRAPLQRSMSSVLSTDRFAVCSERNVHIVVYSGDSSGSSLSVLISKTKRSHLLISDDILYCGIAVNSQTVERRGCNFRENLHLNFKYASKSQELGQCFSTRGL